MESNKAKVEAFVKEKGDGLSFSIAYAGGDDSDFYNKWIKPAGITAIPQTFVIQNNKLAWHTDPMSLNEKVLQLLVDGKFTIDAAKAVMNKQ